MATIPLQKCILVLRKHLPQYVKTLFKRFYTKFVLFTQMQQNSSILLKLIATEYIVEFAQNHSKYETKSFNGFYTMLRD